MHQKGGVLYSKLRVQGDISNQVQRLFQEVVL
jgi:hypothetical protein